MEQGNKSIVLILGMHRSGTSALTRVCNLLGVQLGKDLMPPAEGNNEAGFWEHDKIVAIHDRLLEALGSSWDDVRFLPEKWWEDEKVLPFKQEIKAVIQAELQETSLWGIKDPRLCRLLPLWKAVLEELAITPVCIFTLRNPFDIMMSLKKRDQFSEVKSLLLWLQHIIEAEEWTASYPRVAIEYDQLLQHPEALVEHIRVGTGIEWPVAYAEKKEEIAAFLSNGLRHFHQSKEGNIPASVKAWVMGAVEAASHMEKQNWEQAHALLTTLRKAITEKQTETGDYWAYLCDEVIKERTIIREYDRKLGQVSSALHARNLEIEQSLSQLRQEIRAQKEALIDKECQLLEAQKRQESLQHEVKHLDNCLNAMLYSTSWKITAPIRHFKSVGMIAAHMLNPAIGKHLWRAARRQGVKESIYQVWEVFQEKGLMEMVRYLRKQAMKEPNYQLWIKYYETITDEDRQLIWKHIKSFAHKPLISVVMPVYNIEEKWLREAIDSVIAQLYPNWELCIADDCSTEPHVKQVLTEYSKRDPRIKVVFREQNGHISEASNSALALATGEFVALLDHDDMLPSHALYYVVHEINQHPDVEMIYSDEDKIDEKGFRYGPYFKSDWNPDLFYSQNMFSHLGVYRHALLKKIGGFRKGFEGSQDYDLALRCLLHTSSDKIRHIPHILYHWRAVPGSTALSIDSKNYAVLAARKAMESFFAELNNQVKVDYAELKFGYQRIIWPIPTPAPKVTLIIPTRDGYSLLRMCIDSIKAKTDYPHYEILVVNNQSSDPDTLHYFEQLKAEKNIRVLDYDMPFNFSAINNFAVRHTDAEVIGFINNDIEVITPGWLTEMVSHALRREIGAVGAKLYYPNDTIQHGGVITGAGAADTPVAHHMFHGLPREDFGYFSRAMLTQSLSAVTAACMVMRREVFDELGGFEEVSLKVAFNDIDLCMRIREKGYRIIWTPYAELYHHESATRGYEDTPEKQTRFRKEVYYMRYRWGAVLDNDPYYNPNLDRKGDFSFAFPPRIGKPWHVYERTIAVEEETDNSEPPQAKVAGARR